MIAQLIVNAIIAGAIYTLVGLGFALIFWAGRFFHFAHAAVYAIAAYSAYGLTSWLHTPLLASALFGVAMSGLVGTLMEWGAYRPLRRRRASSLGLLLASFGLMVALQNALSLAFGDDTKLIRTWANIEIGYPILGARITLLQICIIGSAAVSSTLLWVVLHRTKVGRSFRALANDPELAAIYGVNPDRVMVWTLVVGSCLAGVAGILVALDTDLSPTMGMRVLLFSVVAVVIGGHGRIAGVILGGLLIGLAQHVGVLILSTAWQDAIIFGLLILFLLVRPSGFLGRSQQRTTV
jgi:branched-chain amino acid transport system permease protein